MGYTANQLHANTHAIVDIRHVLDITCAEVSTLMAMVKTRIDPALRVKDASRYK